MNENKYNRFLSSLTREFTIRAQPHLRSLWADVMELEEATGEHTLAVAREQTTRRVYALGLAARAANAQEVKELSLTVERLVSTLARAPVAVRFELFNVLHQTMARLTEALCAINTVTPPAHPEGQPTESELVESCTE